MNKHVYVGIASILMTTIAWSQPTLVKDIGTAPAGIFGSGTPGTDNKFTVAGEFFYFPVSDQKGKELWRTDGTADGTFRVIDVNKGVADSYQRGTALGTAFVFVTKPSQLWKTNGTEAGTTSAGNITIDGKVADVSDIWTLGSNVIVPAVAGSKLVFFQYGGSGSVSVLKEIVNDQNVGMTLSVPVGASQVFVLQRYESFLYQAEFWITDGTSAGTKKIASYDDLVNDVTSLGNDIIFENSQNEVLRLSISSANITTLHDFGGTAIDKLYPFNAAKSLISTEDGMWITDGTQANTLLLADQVIDVAEVYVANSKAYFMGYNKSNTRYYIYESDGTAAGTKQLAEVRDAVATPYFVNNSQIALLNNKLIVPITNSQVGMEIANVTATGTTVIRDINPGAVGSDPQMFQVFKNKLFFVANDGTNGPEVWSTDGTEAGTTLLKNSVEGTVSGVTTKDIFSFKDEIYFSASSGSIDNVWRTTGNGDDAEQFFFTNSGNILGTANDSIYMVTNPMMIYKSAGDSAILVADISGSPGEALYPEENFSLGDNFVFGLLSLGGGNAYGQELWTLNWHNPGAQVLKDINPGLSDGLFVPSYGEASQRRYKIDETRALFAADDGVNGVELWITDGTPSGTTLLKDINPGAASSNPRNINAEKDGLVYFATDDGLWSTDGTTAGTVKVNSFSSINNVLSFNSDIYVTAVDGTAWGIYKSNGNKVQSLPSKPGEMIALGDQLYVSVDNGLVVNSETINISGTPSNFEIFKDQLYFAADGQLWHSTGTAPTTRVAADIDPIKFKQLNGLLYMTASSKDYGIELFRTDVQKFSQDISFEVSNKTVTDAPFQLTATTTSGLPVTFELLSGGVTLSGSTVTIKSAGIVQIKAKQAGDATFDPAEVTVTFSIDAITGVGEDVASVKIYPNPVERDLFVTAPGHLRILDASGREVMSQDVEDSVDLSSLNTGFYIAILNSIPIKLIKR